MGGLFGCLPSPFSYESRNTLYPISHAIPATRCGDGPWAGADSLSVSLSLHYRGLCLQPIWLRSAVLCFAFSFGIRSYSTLEGLVRTENYFVVTAPAPALFNGGQMSCMMGRDMVGYGYIYLTA
jgi:hypothetical protein